MLNWIKFLTVFLIALTSVLVITIFYNAYKPISKANTNASNKAIQSGQVVSINNVQVYNGTKPLITVFGLNDAGEEVAVFVDETSKADYKEVKLKDGITAEKAEQMVRDEVNMGKVLHVSLGIEEEGPVWEVVFKSDNGKLNYVYLLFEDGHWWKRILNL